jgi:hypothetical protein
MSEPNEETTPNRRGTQLEEAIQQNAATLNGEECSTAYKSEWKRYKEWVDESIEEGLDLDEPSPYLTRYNVDMYFQLEVVNRGCAMNQVNRIKWALEWFARHQEYSSGESFVVNSLAVEQAISAQQVAYKGNQEVGDKCPHRFCKESMSISDRLKLLRVAYKRSDFGTAAVAINAGQNAAVRGASSRSFTLSDLRTSRVFGPEGHKSGDSKFSRALMMVLRKGAAHKDRFSQVKQVCTWRHREYLLDTNFAMGINLIWKLRNMGRQLKFQKPRGGNRRPKWWDVELIDWKSYNRKYPRYNSRAISVVQFSCNKCGTILVQ